MVVAGSPQSREMSFSPNSSIRYHQVFGGSWEVGCEGHWEEPASEDGLVTPKQEPGTDTKSQNNTELIQHTSSEQVTLGGDVTQNSGLLASEHLAYVKNSTSHQGGKTDF